MKEYLNFALARVPALYRALLRLRGSKNKEKFAYLTLVKTGDTVFDVGANVGYYTILFSHLVGNLGQVHAFEAVTATFATLTRRLERELIYKNVLASHNAISNIDGKTIDIFVPGSDFGQASLATHKVGSWSKGDIVTTYKTMTITLDTYIQHRGIERVDFVKIDVEGAELLVLQGARHMLEKFRPTLLLEYYDEWARQFESSPAILFGLLTKLGYRFFYLEDFTLLRDPVRFVEENPHSLNVICSVARL